MITTKALFYKNLVCAVRGSHINESLRVISRAFFMPERKCS